MRPRLTYAQKSVLLQLVNHGDMQPADGNHKRTFQSLEERGYTQDVGYGRYAITEAGRKDIKAITGGGGCQEYFNMMPENDAIWIASALYSPLMVEDAVDVALAVLSGEEVEAVKVIPTAIVDRTNAADYLDPNSVY